MSVYINGVAQPGTTRTPASRGKIMKRREARRIWKAEEAKFDGRYSPFYGRRRIAAARKSNA